MNFRNILWTYAPKQDGSCDVKLYFSHLGKKRYFSLDIKIQPKYWNKKKGEVKSTHPLAKRYNGKLNRLRLDIETHFLDGGNWLNLFNEEEDKKGNVIEFLVQIITEGENNQLGLNSDTLKSYKGTLRRLREFKDHTGIETTLQKMDMTFYSEFTNYLYKHANCRAPGVNGHIKILKRLMNIGLERKLHTNMVHLQSGFKRPRLNIKDNIYVSEAEVALLEKLDLSKKKFLEKELDRWLVAYHFILRFSDLEKVTKNRIEETLSLIHI